MNVKKILSGWIVFGVVLSSSIQTVSAVSAEGSFEGDPDVSGVETVVVPNPVTVNNDFDVVLKTSVAGADLWNSLDVLLDGGDLGMQIVRKQDDMNVLFLPIILGRDSFWYKVAMPDQSTLKVTINVDDTRSLDVIDGSTFEAGDYVAKFGRVDETPDNFFGGFESVFSNEDFIVKADDNPVQNLERWGFNFNGVDFGDLTMEDLNNADFNDLFVEADDDQFVILPDKMIVLPTEVKTGEKVRVYLYKNIVGVGDIRLSLPFNWDLQLWTAAGIGVPETLKLSFKKGDFQVVDLENSSADVYDFVAPQQQLTYYVKLADDEGNLVAKTTVKVKAKVQNPFDDIFVLPDEDDLIDWSDVIDDIVVGDDDDGDEDEGNDDGGDDDDMAEVKVRCSDLGEDDWEYEMVNTLIGMGNFPVEITPVSIECRTKETVNRKEFTAWLLKAYHPQEVENIDNVDLADMPFSDVGLDDPYAPYILRAYELGIINGHPDGTFRPNLGINRAEVLKILLISSGIFRNRVNEIDQLMQLYGDDRPDKKFRDIINDKDWFYGYLWYAISREIIQGYPDGTAKMGRTVLYGEAAKILYLSLKLQGRIQN